MTIKFCCQRKALLLDFHFEAVVFSARTRRLEEERNRERNEYMKRKRRREEKNREKIERMKSGSESRVNDYAREK